METNHCSGAFLCLLLLSVFKMVFSGSFCSEHEEFLSFGDAVKATRWGEHSSAKC